MNIEVNDQFKFASVWLTNEEKDNQQIREDLIPIVNEFRARKFKFVIYESGKGNLQELTESLLIHNKNLAIHNA